MASLHRVSAVLCLAVGSTYAVEQGDPARTTPGGASATNLARETVLPRKLNGAQHSEHWKKLDGLAADEGEQLGDVAFLAQPSACTAHCDAHAGCNSVTYCPTWGGCFLKDGIFTGHEATSSGSDCLTYYKIKDTTPAPVPTTSVKVPSSCAGYSPEMQGIDFSGTLLAKLQASDAKLCCALCDSFAGCEGYVFHLDQCYLKKDLSRPTQKLWTVTRLRLASPAGAGASLRGSVIYP